MLSGRNADPEFYSRILKIALDHQPDLVHQIDTLKVYHFGAQFLVLHITYLSLCQYETVLPFTSGRVTHCAV